MATGKAETAAELVATIRGRIEQVDQKLINHPYLAALERREIPRDKLRFFVCEQHSIIESDLRSVAHLVSRFGGSLARDFFIDVFLGEKAAAAALPALAKSLGVTDEALEAYEPHPGAYAYTAFMSWMALYGSAAEFTATILVNFPAWGSSCGRMGRALKEQYQFQTSEVAFFELFATPAETFEEEALAVIEMSLNQGAVPSRVTRAAILLQAYELMFWDAHSELSL